MVELTLGTILAQMLNFFILVWILARIVPSVKSTKVVPPRYYLNNKMKATTTPMIGIASIKPIATNIVDVN